MNSISTRRFPQILSAAALLVFLLAASPFFRDQTTRASGYPAPFLQLQDEPQDPSTPDPLIQGIIDQIQPEKLLYYVDRLSGIQPVRVGGEIIYLKSRGTYHPQNNKLAAQYLYEQLVSMGLDASYQQFRLEDQGAFYNVIAEQPGEAGSGCTYLLTAHLDAVPHSPGADDNGSGTAGVLVAASVLSRYRFECTLRYIFFSAEEQGLHGSRAYAQEIAASGEKISGALNLDMLGYNSPGSSPVINIHTRKEEAGEQDLEIANAIVSSVDVYDLDIEPQPVADGLTASDQASFWEIGVPAVLVVEPYDDRNPAYHSPDDRPEHLDEDFYTDVIRASIAAFAHLATPAGQPGIIQGTAFDLASRQPLPGLTVEVSSRNGLTFQTRTGPDGAYHIVVPPAFYRISAAREGYEDKQVFEIDTIAQVPVVIDLAMLPVPALEVSPQRWVQFLRRNESSSFFIELENLSSSPVVWRFMDDPGAGWLQVSGRAGSIDGSRQRVRVTVTANGLQAGRYSTTLDILSNDFDQPFLSIPVSLYILDIPASAFYPQPR